MHVVSLWSTKGVTYSVREKYIVVEQYVVDDGDDGKSFCEEVAYERVLTDFSTLDGAEAYIAARGF